MVWFVIILAFQNRVVSVWLLMMLVAVSVMVSVMVAGAVTVAPSAVEKEGQPTMQSHAEVMEVLAIPERKAGQSQGSGALRLERRWSMSAGGRGKAVGEWMARTGEARRPGGTSRGRVVVRVEVV